MLEDEVKKLLGQFGLQDPVVYEKIEESLIEHLSSKGLECEVTSLRDKTLTLTCAYPNNTLISYEVDEMLDILDTVVPGSVKEIRIKKKLI